MIEKHFCVSCYVYNKEERKFLLVNHKKLGAWIQPGGHMEPNEDPEEACIREVFEETGLKVKLLGKRFMRDFDYICPLSIQKNEINPEHIHMDLIYVAVIEEGELKLNERESNGLKWFSLSEILAEDFNTFPDVKDWCKYIIENY